MEGRNFGYLENPPNSLDIIRARTLLGNLRLWDIPRGEETLDLVINEWGKIEAEVNSKKTFIRAGSSKSKGWQVTFRGEKPNGFKNTWNWAMVFF
jgi:hypothetical protein